MAELPILDPRAAFVDVGSEQMHVSVAGGPPQVFGTVTLQLQALRQWLIEQQVSSVAMEATGVYWLPLYSELERAGLKVIMVNGRQTRNVPGRKSDMMDCQWGATLHAHGLLRPGFVPPAHIRQLQDYMRLRDDHIRSAASHVQHMQKALERMNIKLHDTISSLTGVSGLAVVRAILAGQRDPQELLALCDVQIQRKKAERVKESLRGTWADEHVFALSQALQSWEHYQRQIAECDQRVAALLEQAVPHDTAGGAHGPQGPQRPRRGPRKGASENAPKIEGLREKVAAMCGEKDLSVLPAHTEYGVLRLISEVGTDLSKWKTEKHFTSWTGLAPGSEQSGKRRRSIGRKRNQVGRMFCVMARSLARSKNVAFGGFYRRMAARRGTLVANVALARKLAALFWRMMVKGGDFVETGLAAYEAKVLQGKQRAVQRLAKELGMQVTPLPSAA